MKKPHFKMIYYQSKYLILLLLFLLAQLQIIAQTVTNPQVPFSQRTSVATPAKTIYNVKGDFTMLGNTNLTLENYSVNTDNESRSMKYVDIDGDPNTWNSSLATLELSSSGENSASQNCSTVLFAGLYWTGKSDDADTFTTSKQVQSGTKVINTNSAVTDGKSITNTNYSLNITRGGSNNNRYPIYTFSGNSNTYTFYYSNTTGVPTVTLSINGGTATNIPVTITTSGPTETATLNTSHVISDGTVNLTIKQLIRSTSTNLSPTDIQGTSSASINVSGSIPTYTTQTKNYDKKVVSLKGPGASVYTSITAKSNGANSEIRFPGSANSGIFVGYQEITEYVKTYGSGAYSVADIALTEGTNSNPGLSGGWVMVVIYENPLMKSRAVTLFDGYAYVNGQRSGGGEFGNIDISGFTTVGSGQVNMKLGLMTAEGDVALSGDYLAVQKLNANPAVFPGNYLELNHAGNSINNFFNSSIFPLPTAGNSNPNLVNNTGVDFSMFTIPNANNSVIANNQTATTFRFGSSSDVFTIFGFAMSVDAYIPEPKGLININSINNVTNPSTLNALPGQTINYSLNITNEGTEATNNTIITIPIPATAIFHTGTITYKSFPYSGFTPTTNVPIYNSGTNTITWDLGILPIKSGNPGYQFYDLSFTLDVTTDCIIILNAGCSPEVSLETGTIKGRGATSGSAFTKYFFQGYDDTSCHLPIDGSIKVAIDASSCFSSMAGPDQITSCGGESVILSAATGTTGKWDIVSGPTGGGEIFSNNTSPSSTFYSPNLGVYTLRWTTNCNTTDNVVITFTLCNVVNFDGIDDHINFKNNYNLNSGNFSIEAWVKPNATNGNTQSIISKRLSPSSTDGYDLRLVNNIISFNWNNNSIIATHAIDINRWYHIALTFDGTNYKLYIDGIVEKTASGNNPTSNSVDCILGAMSQNTNIPYSFYNGYTDELRMWNISLTEDQIRKMMNQEIINDGSGNIKGAIIPKNINGLNWTNLTGYYQMNRASDISNGYLIDKSGNSKNGKLKGIYVQEPDTAPLPYTSGANGNWEDDATWTNSAVWDVPYSFGIDGTTKIDWNIVKTSHNITSKFNKTVLGLLIESNSLSVANDSKMEISSYLKLDGKIDLNGMSQLVQTAESDLDVTSSGSIERDQQGQSSLYNYNYWSSPVSPINIAANNTNYTVGGMLKDGTTATPQNINWIGGYNGSATTPISLARYWLFKFDNYANAYANWASANENGALRVGQGFTLKGSGSSSGTQNYTFVGKPNNGTITANSVSPNQLLLAGNPYPSALDSEAFINDNLNSIDGSLYFWEHYTTNNTHVLRDYQGGYAVRNLTAGVPPVSPALISGLGTSSKIPGKFIPVGQGFFISGNSGSVQPIVTFKNSQRAFQKETENVSNTLFKAISNIKNPKIGDNNNSDPIIKDTFKKVRLGFNSNNNYHRQVVIGFMDENATSGMDYGYEGYNFDNFPNDMYFLNGENKLVIQGEGFFDAANSYPIGIKTNVEGIISFSLDGLENFNKNQEIYIFDKETTTYHNIKDQLFEIVLPAGVFENRFNLCFKNKKKENNPKPKHKDKDNQDDRDDNNDENEKDNKRIQINYSLTGRVLNVKNSIPDTVVNTVSIYNISGQFITKWDTAAHDQTDIQIPVLNISSGIYIAKLHTSSGDISKKIIIN